MSRKIKKYIKGNKEIEFDDIKYIIENDGMYLDSESIHILSGVPLRTIQRNCKEVLEEYKEYYDFTPNMALNLYIDKKTSGRPKRFYIHYIVGDVLHRLKSPKAFKFRIWANEKTFKKPEQPKTLEQDAKQTISYLRNKVYEETKLAFEAKTTQEFNEHMDLADKYAMDANKRDHQLKNVIKCNKRLERESELNRQGVLTESGSDKVFVPRNQSRLTDFGNNSKIEGKNNRRLP